jgi:hypothetical protein
VKAGETRFICLGERPKRKPPFPVEVWKLDEDGNIVIEADKGR